jgi:hypothetical protein
VRTIDDHMVKGDHAPQLTITVLDEPGPGGANHLYRVSGNYRGSGDAMTFYTDISFQNGHIKEAGVNVISHEVLLAIIIDRLRSFQAGPYATALNAEALKHCRAALLALQMRTHERIKRGVEGTSAK